MSPDGLCDLVGNVWEWIAAERIGEEKIIGGGWYSDGSRLNLLDPSPRLRDREDAGIGIRLARDVPSRSR